MFNFYFLRPASLCIRAKASLLSIIGCLGVAVEIVLEADPNDSLIVFFLAVVAFKDSVKVSNTSFTSLTQDEEVCEEDEQTSTDEDEESTSHSENE